jgi:hypothetical protein
MQRFLFTTLVFATIVASVHGQDSGDDASTTKPGPEHTNLMAFVGTWELTLEGSEKKGSAEIKSILDGRFITEDVTLPFGSFNMDWHGVIGYDPAHEQYTGIWFDNMNNTTKSNTGEADKTGRIITFRGQQVGHGKFIWRISNDGGKAMTIEMFQVGTDGKETPVMKVHGVKQK